MEGEEQAKAWRKRVEDLQYIDGLRKLMFVSLWVGFAMSS
jgi:hypothetical protein